MLRIAVPISPEGWDESKQEFVEPETKVLELEHSLASLSKWESKWRKAFLTRKEKSTEEVLDYVRCMTLTPNVDPELYNHLTSENFQKIREYIEDPMTATYFPEETNGKKSNEVATAELIHYWMISLNIPPEYENWHLNRLIAQVRVCNMKNQPPKKMSKRDIMSRNAAINAARRQELNSRG
jgi:hypothetical protein